MASDLKLEIFAFHLFQRYWNTLLPNELKNLSLYPEEYGLDPDNAQIFEDSHYKAFTVKNLFYLFVFYDRFSRDHDSFEPSPHYISDYISRTCDGLFGDQTVFELLFSSCAFVIQLCLTSIGRYEYYDILNYAHLCWAMYFDQYKEEFYRQGGWNQLRTVSVSYFPVDEVLVTLPNMNSHLIEYVRAYLCNIIRAVDNYKTFTSCVHSNCKTVSKAWVIFHLQNCYKSDFFGENPDMALEQEMMDPKAVEKFLLKFRSIFDPKGSDVLNIKAQYKYSDSRKQILRNDSQQLSKPNVLALSNTTANKTCNPDKKQNERNLQETDDQTDKLIAIDLCRVKRNDDHTIGKIVTYLSLKKDTSPTNSENDAYQNASFLKPKMTSSVDFPWKTINISEQKLDEEHIKKIDLERESPDVKWLLRMILVLGNPKGVNYVRSSPPSSDTLERKKKSKKKSYCC